MDKPYNFMKLYKSVWHLKSHLVYTEAYTKYKKFQKDMWYVYGDIKFQTVTFCMKNIQTAG